MTPVEQRILANPAFHTLVKRRQRFMWLLLGTMLGVFFSYVIVLTFRPSLLAVPLWQGAVMTVSVPAGIAVIIISLFLTGIYVYRANREFDQSTQEILKQAESADAE